MNLANILLRTAGGTDIGWEYVLRTLALEEYLRTEWPTVRVTVVAEGDDPVLDYLYSRVRDLVALSPGLGLAEELSARGLRDAADLVLFDVPAIRSDQREAWMRGTRHLLVREDLDRVDQDGRTLAYEIWSSGHPVGQAVAGTEHALLDPTLPKWARSRHPARIPGKHLLVSLGSGSVPQAELMCAEALAKREEEWDRITFVCGHGVHASQKNAIARILPSARILAGSRRMPELLASADLALIAGSTLRHELACVGTPGALLALNSQDGPAAAKFSEGGSVRYMGSYDRVSANELAESLRDLRNSNRELATQARKGPRYVDGGGVPRLLNALFPGHTHATAS